MFYESFGAEQSPENRWLKETTAMLKGLGIGIRPMSEYGGAVTQNLLLLGEHNIWHPNNIGCVLFQSRSMQLPWQEGQPTEILRHRHEFTRSLTQLLLSRDSVPINVGLFK